MPTKKTAAKKPAAKKPAAKKAAATKPAAKKAAATKPAAKKAAATKPAAKKAAATKPAAKKAAAKKPVAKKTTTSTTTTAKKTAFPKKEDAAASVADYIAGLLPWQREIVVAVEALLKREAPKFTGSIKWGHPVYEQNGKPFALTRAAAKHVLFGFWGKEAPPDPRGLLEGESLRHVKLKTVQDVAQPGLVEILRAAIALNKAG